LVKNNSQIVYACNYFVFSSIMPGNTVVRPVFLSIRNEKTVVKKV